MTDQPIELRAEILISWLLRIGVGLSFILLVSGIGLIFRHHPTYRSSSAELAALTSVATEYPHTVGSVLSSAANGHGQGIAMLGLLLLIATPVLRVAVSIVLFAIERDVRFVAITSLVLVLLLFSFVAAVG